MRRRKAKQPSQAEMEKSWCGVVWCGDSAGASQAEMENELRNSKKSTMRSKMTQIFFHFPAKKIAGQAQNQNHLLTFHRSVQTLSLVARCVSNLPLSWTGA
jgi:peptidyl-tRNA hydrolase